MSREKLRMTDEEREIVIDRALTDLVDMVVDMVRRNPRDLERVLRAALEPEIVKAAQEYEHIMKGWSPADPTLQCGPASLRCYVRALHRHFGWSDPDDDEAWKVTFDYFCDENPF